MIDASTSDVTAITLIDESFTLNDGSGSVDTVTQNWRVEFNGRNWETDNAIDAGPVGGVSVPVMGDEHPKNAGLKVRNKTATPNPQSNNIWIVVVEYISSPFTGVQTLSWGTAQNMIAVDEDVFSNPITNSSFQSFDPPLQAQHSDLTLSITKEWLDPDLQLISSYVNTVNEQEFFGFAPGQVKMADFSATQISGDLSDGYIVTYKFVIREPYGFNNNSLFVPSDEDYLKSWHIRVLDQGDLKLTSDNEQTASTPDEDNPATTGMVLLNSEGGRVAVGETPNWLTFQVYFETDFSALGLEADKGPDDGE